jgi:hypothetical protein
MAEPGQNGDALSKFAEGHGLAYTATAELPTEGSTLGEKGKVDGAASGKLGDGLEGTLAHYSYVYTWTDADDHTHSETRHFTIVVARIPESIGFVPYLGFSGPSGHFSPFAGSAQTEPVDLGEDKALDGCSSCVYKGTSKTWLPQLFSPTLLDWLARSDGDFGFELANGVLCVGRSARVDDAQGLEGIWSDGAHLAEAIRKECMEEVESGDAATDSAREVDAEDPRMEAALAEAKVPSPPAIGSARPAFNSVLLRKPSTYFGGIGRGFLLWLIVNVFLSALTINVYVQANGTTKNVTSAIELVLLLIFVFFAVRRLVRGRSAKYAEEAFYRAYGADRNLALEAPLRFAATHAEAKLPFKPDRVFTGTLPGGLEGSLVLAGDGSKRSDRIAMVAGPKGPFSEEELQADGEGITAKLLDRSVQRLEEAVTAPTAKG